MADNSLGAKVGVPVVQYNGGPFVTQATYTAFTNAAQVTPSVNIVKIRPEGDHIRIRAEWGKGTATVSTANIVTFNLPAGLSMDPASLTNGFTDRPIVGIAQLFRNAASDTLNLIARAVSATTITFSRENNTQLIESVLATNDILFIDVLVPLLGSSSYLAYGAGLATSVKAGLVSYYDEGTLTVTWNNTTPSNTTVGVSYVRVGKQVTLSFGPQSGTSSSSTNFSSLSGVLPLALRPINTMTFTTPLTATNGVLAGGRAQIDNAGAVSINYNTSTGSFTSGATYAINSFAISYTVN